MRRRHLILGAAAVLLLAGVAAGCGSEGTKTATPQTVIGTVPKPSTPTTTVPSAGDPAAGKDVFLNVAGCGGCHTLSAAGSTGTVGPTHKTTNAGSPDDATTPVPRTIDNGSRTYPPSCPAW